MLSILLSQASGSGVTVRGRNSFGLRDSQQVQMLRQRGLHHSALCTLLRQDTWAQGDATVYVIYFLRRCRLLRQESLK